jgi:hypothetical protein
LYVLRYLSEHRTATLDGLAEVVEAPGAAYDRR